jgi:predicted PurR-regulated permease PerM
MMAEPRRRQPAAGAKQPGVAVSLRAAGRISWAIIGLVIVAGFFVVAFAFTSSVSVPVVIAVVLAIVFRPVTDWLVDRGWSRGLAAAAALIGMLLVVIGVIALVAGTLVANWDEISADLSDAADEIDDWLSNTPLSDTLASEVKDSADSSGSTLATGVGAGLSSVFNSVAGVIAGMFFGLWVAFYVLQGGYVEDPSGDGASMSGSRAKLGELTDFAQTSIRGYYTSLTVLGLFDAVFIAVPMALMGIPGAVSVGVVTLVGSYIPYVGAFVAGGFAVLLALADGGISSALIMLAIVLVVQNTMENIVQPKITAHYVTLSPLAVLLATAFGGAVAGLLGLILAVPFTAVAFKATKITRESDGAPSPATTKDASTHGSS